MTKESLSDTITIGLIQYQPNVVQRLLAPLTTGQAVTLLVEDIRLPKKTRKYKTLLVLCPMRLLGLDTPAILASMPPYGCEVLDLSTELKAGAFVRLGLSFSLSSALVDALRNTLWSSI